MLPRRPMQRASLIIYIIYAVHRHIRCPPAPAMEPNPRGRGSDAGASAMNLRLPAAAAFAATLVCFAAAAAFAGDAAPEDDAVCTGRAPFREVAPHHRPETDDPSVLLAASRGRGASARLPSLPPG